MRVAIHQPNFTPWFPYFYKMSCVDKFVLLNQVQFEKNGFQNRYRLSSGKWVTKPVVAGTDKICNKFYTDGLSLVQHNIDIIYWIKQTLGIEAELVPDVLTNSSSTQRLIDNLNYHGATVYVTNPTAKDKYLDEDMIRKAGIDIEYCDTQYKLHIWEMFEKFGIEGTKKQLYKQKVEHGGS